MAIFKKGGRLHANVDDYPADAKCTCGCAKKIHIAYRATSHKACINHKNCYAFSPKE